MNYIDILDKIREAIEGETHLDRLARKKQDPFKILISTILSARTRDSNTEEATKTLFARFNTPELIANAEVEELEKLIFKSGFYKVKAARIKEVSQIIKDRFYKKDDTWVQSITENEENHIIGLAYKDLENTNDVEYKDYDWQDTLFRDYLEKHYEALKESYED